MRAQVVVFGACACALVARRATAEEERGFSIGTKPAYFVTAGVTQGVSLVAHDRGYYLGGEVSWVRMHRGLFAGLYGDGFYDFGAKRSYATGGLEFGYKFVGIDGGAAARFGDNKVAVGPTGRLFFTIGLVGLYARYAYFYEPLRADNDHVVQVGALLKFPFAAWGGH